MMIPLCESIEKLNSEDEAERLYAAEDIGYANQAAGVEPLLARMTAESSRAVREAIVSALAQIEDDAVIAGAVAWLDSEDAFVRNQAVEILRDRGAGAIPSLASAFSEGGRDRRKLVIDILSKTSDARATELYQRALADRDPNVVIAAVESLGALRHAGLRLEIEGLISKDAHPMLLCACLETLARIGDPASRDAVYGRLGPAGEVPGYLRPSYVKFLGACGDSKDAVEIASLIGHTVLAGPVLNAVASLRHRNPALKLPGGLAQSLREIVTQSTPSLNGYQAVRLLAAFLPDPDVLEFLKSCLEHADKVIRIGAIQALQERPIEQGRAAIERLAACETDEEVLQAMRGEGAQ